MMGDGAGALDGIQVLDLSMDFAGALVAMTLADHGAEVIRIASEGALERTFAHRGKVRISSGDDLEGLLADLLEMADVVIEDAPLHRCRARDLLKDPERGQIHCWVPAFPDDHPEARVRGFEGITQAHMGIYEVPLGRKPVYHSLSILPVTAAAYASCGVVAALLANPPALRHRLIRLVADAEFGLALSRAQTLEIARLATDWHGQGAVHLSGIRVEREGGRIVFRSTTPEPPADPQSD